MKTVTRHVEFEMAHLLPKYPGRCANLHGHTYKLEVTVASTKEVNDSPYGFIIDFKTLDAILKDCVPDHMFAYNQNAADDSVEWEIVEVLKKHGLALAPFKAVTSAENMIDELIETISKFLPEGLVIVRADLWETTNSHATRITPEYAKYLSIS